MSNGLPDFISTWLHPGSPHRGNRQPFQTVCVFSRTSAGLKPGVNEKNRLVLLV